MGEGGRERQRVRETEGERDRGQARQSDHTRAEEWGGGTHISRDQTRNVGHICHQHRAALQWRGSGEGEGATEWARSNGQVASMPGKGARMDLLSLSGRMQTSLSSEPAPTTVPVPLCSLHTVRELRISARPHLHFLPHPVSQIWAGGGGWVF